MRLALGVTVLATATACGGEKPDPYAASLARGSEHIEIRGVVDGGAIRGYGDFTNETGHMIVITNTGAVLEEVVAGHRIYVKNDGQWSTSTAAGFLTPSQVFLKRVPARIENGLVRSVTFRNAHGRETITFSRYGEHVSVTVPRVKGSH
ncbi:MAG TPA: hypothetical protein VI408_07265 [Gaiellaceae bacterium]